MVRLSAPYRNALRIAVGSLLLAAMVIGYSALRSGPSQPSADGPRPVATSAASDPATATDRSTPTAVASTEAAAASDAVSAGPAPPGAAASLNRTARPAAQTQVPLGVTVTGGPGPATGPASSVSAPARTSASAADRSAATDTGRPKGAKPSASLVPAGAGPSAVVSVAADSDGCDHNYGVTGQCIPVHAPGGGPETCTSLAAGGYFSQPLVVRIDSLHLMQKPDVQMGTSADGKYMTVAGCTD